MLSLKSNQKSISVALHLALFAVALVVAAAAAVKLSDNEHKLNEIVNKTIKRGRSADE